MILSDTIISFIILFLVFFFTSLAFTIYICVLSPCLSTRHKSGKSSLMSRVILDFLKAIKKSFELLGRGFLAVFMRILA